MKRGAAKRITVLIASFVIVSAALIQPAASASTGTRIPTQYAAVSFPTRYQGFVVAYSHCRIQTPAGAEIRLVCTGYLLHTPDGGASWRSYRLRMHVDAVNFVNASDGWAVASQGYGTADYHPGAGLYRTRDGGRTWTLQLHEAGRYSIAGFHLLNPSAGWVMVRRFSLSEGYEGAGRVFETSDAGRIWRRVSIGDLFVTGYGAVGTRFRWATAQISQLQPSAAAPYCCPVSHPGPTYRNALYVSDDAGRSWSKVLDVPGGRMGTMLVAFPNARDGRVLTTSGQPNCSMGGCYPTSFWTTANGGRTWAVKRVLPRDWSGFPDGIKFSSPSDGWVVFNAGAGPGAGGVAETSTRGRHWTRSLPCDRYLASTSLAVTGPRSAWLAEQNQCNVVLSHGITVPASAVLHTVDAGHHWRSFTPKAG